MNIEFQIENGYKLSFVSDIYPSRMIVDVFEISSGRLLYWAPYKVENNKYIYDEKWYTEHAFKTEYVITEYFKSIIEKYLKLLIYY